MNFKRLSTEFSIYDAQVSLTYIFAVVYSSVNTAFSPRAYVCCRYEPFTLRAHTRAYARITRAYVRVVWTRPITLRRAQLVSATSDLSRIYRLGMFSHPGHPFYPQRDGKWVLAKVRWRCAAGKWRQWLISFVDKSRWCHVKLCSASLTRVVGLSERLRDDYRV